MLVCTHTLRGRKGAPAGRANERGNLVVVPPHWGRDPTPTKPKGHEHVGPVLSPSVLFARWRCPKRMNALSKAHEAARRARKDRLERARSVSVEGPDEPHSRSARNEETGLSSRVRTSRLCPCVVMRGLRCVPRSKIRGSKLYNTDIGIKLLTRRIRHHVAHWRRGPKDRCAGVRNDERRVR